MIRVLKVSISSFIRPYIGTGLYVNLLVLSIAIFFFYSQSSFTRYTVANVRIAPASASPVAKRPFKKQGSRTASGKILYTSSSVYEKRFSILETLEMSYDVLAI